MIRGKKRKRLKNNLKGLRVFKNPQVEFESFVSVSEVSYIAIHLLWGPQQEKNVSIPQKSMDLPMMQSKVKLGQAGDQVGYISVSPVDC